MNTLKTDLLLIIVFCILSNCSTNDPIETFKFDPAEGKVIRKPEGNERGYWVGAPGIFFDEEKELFYLTYRLHTHECYPNTNIMKRGHIARIATSKDGIEFTDIKEFRNEDFNSSSLGRASIIKCNDGMYRYFMCQDNPDKTQWVIGYIESPTIEEFDPKNWKPVFTSGDAIKESLRDPYVFSHDGTYYLFVNIERISWGEKSSTDDYEQKYEGVTVKRSTGLAISSDGANFQWKGEVFTPPENSWDSDCRRITSIIDFNNKFVGFYDGRSGYENNHEDFCALVTGSEITAMKPVNPKIFTVKSPWGTGSCRYVDALRLNNKLYIYYECSREDESHDLRVVVK